MAQFDEAVQRSISQLDGVIDVDRARHVWQRALEVSELDWSSAGVGDPAREAMLAWSLPSDARRNFRRALGLDDTTWARARCWVVEQMVFYIPYYAKSLPLSVDQAMTRLSEALLGD